MQRRVKFELCGLGTCERWWDNLGEWCGSGLGLTGSGAVFVITSLLVWHCVTRSAQDTGVVAWRLNSLGVYFIS